jgi:ATP-dependent DNA helicase RecG
LAREKFEPRKLMEKAIAVMHESIRERREDGKVSPLVGTLLYKPDGTIETACRGELRDGDHAEYTLLERKNRSTRLDGCKLFATLEPCAPGSRSHSKRSCAERIVAARIKEVWIGIEDPDPTVDRKGIKYLQDNGVTLHMFDRDLQEAIYEANAQFIDQALGRADEERRPKKITLSELEHALDAADATDFSIEALDKYRSIAQIKDEVRSPNLNRRLLQQGLLKEKDGQLVPTGFGLLLFGREPRVVMPQAGLLATIHYPDGEQEFQDFDGPMVLIPASLEKWFGDKLPNVIDRSTMQRRSVPSIPAEMIREAVVNALIHRDYEIRQCKCQLVITNDTIVISSPGGPPLPITLDQLKSFTAPMLSRNPELHYVFGKMGMAEERGLGINSLKSRSQQMGLPLPKYTWDDPYLVLTIFRNREAATGLLGQDIVEALNDAEKKGWQWITGQGKANSSQYAKAMQVDDRTARRHLNHFVELGLVRKTGAARTTEYETI